MRRAAGAAPEVMRILDAAAGGRAAAGADAPEATDVVEELAQALRQASLALRELRSGTGVDGAHGPRTGPSIPGVPNGTPVLDASLGQAELRSRLARYAPVIALGDGALNIGGAAVHRDVARWLGHPLAELQFGDGTTQALHAQAQLGAAEGYATLDEAIFAANQLLGAGPGGVSSVEAVVPISVRDAGGARRVALLASADPVVRRREAAGFWGGSSEQVQVPDHVVPLRYHTEGGPDAPALGLVDRADGGEWRPAASEAHAAPRADSGSLMPSRQLDGLAIVGYDPDMRAAIGEHERLVDTLSERMAKVVEDPAKVERARSPEVALRYTQAEAVMEEIGLDSTAGWSSGQLTMFRDALVDGGRTTDEARATLEVLRDVPQVLVQRRIQALDEGVLSLNRSTIADTSHIDGDVHAELLAAALRSAAEPALLVKQIERAAAAMDSIFVDGHHVDRMAALSDSKVTLDAAWRHYAGFIAEGIRSGRPPADFDALRGIRGSSLDPQLRASVMREAAASSLSAPAAVEAALEAVATAADPSSVLDAARARLRAAELAAP